MELLSSFLSHPRCGNSVCVSRSPRRGWPRFHRGRRRNETREAERMGPATLSANSGPWRHTVKPLSKLLTQRASVAGSFWILAWTSQSLHNITTDTSVSYHMCPQETGPISLSSEFQWTQQCVHRTTKRRETCLTSGNTNKKFTILHTSHLSVWLSVKAALPSLLGAHFTSNTVRAG